MVIEPATEADLDELSDLLGELFSEESDFRPNKQKQLAIWKLRLRVSCVMLIHAFWQQSFPAALAPAGERGPSAFGFHACAKAMLTFAGAFGWLVGAFHKSERVISPGI